MDVTNDRLAFELPASALPAEIAEQAEKLWAACSAHITTQLDGRAVPENRHPDDAQLMAGDLALQAILMRFIDHKGDNPPRVSTMRSVMQMVAHLFGSVIVNSGAANTDEMLDVFNVVVSTFMASIRGRREHADG